MPYVRNTWVDNSPPDINAANLNNIEAGIVNAPYGPDASANFVPIWNGSAWTYAGVKNAQVDAAAAIAYSKLNLAGSIVNADIASGAAIALSKLASNPTGQPLGLTGATAATRYVGATASGAPASGTFAVGDFIIDQTGKVFVCTAAGTPGTWVQVGAAGNTTYRKTTAKVVNTTVSPTDLLNSEITFAANDLGTNKVATLVAHGDWKNNSGAGTALPRFQIVLGGTTILDTGAIASDAPNAATRYGWRIVCEIAELGATNSQSVTIAGQITHGTLTAAAGTFTTGEGTYASGSGAGAVISHFVGWNSAAKDDTGTLALVLNVINASASASYETALKDALVAIA